MEEEKGCNNYPDSVADGKEQSLYKVIQSRWLLVYRLLFLGGNIFCNMNYGISPIYCKGGLEPLISSIRFHRVTCGWSYR